MENFVHFIQRENIAIFKRRLAETKDLTMRGVLLQLLGRRAGQGCDAEIREVRPLQLAASLHLTPTQGRELVNPPAAKVSGVGW